MHEKISIKIVDFKTKLKLLFDIMHTYLTTYMKKEFLTFLKGGDEVMVLG